MMTLLTRSSTFALRRVSTSERTVGGASKKDPTKPNGSISSRLPLTRTTSVELPATRGSRPMRSAVTTRAAAETNTAAITRTITSQTPRLAATKSLLKQRSSSIAPDAARDGRRGGFYTAKCNFGIECRSCDHLAPEIPPKPCVFNRLGCGAGFAEWGAMEAPTTGTVVLVAEDDPHALSGYVEFLTTAGFIASGRGDGREALATALETVPDVVVTDIAMPGLDGFGLAAALRADRMTKHVPIVGMTAHWTAEIQSEAQRAGFSAMLLKPCLPTHL